MRKILLILLGLLIGITVTAQQRNYTSIKKAIPENILKGMDHAELNAGLPGEWDNAGVIYNRSGDLLKIPVSTSLNIFGLFLTDQRVVSAIPEANMVVFSNRAGGPMGATGNDLKVCYSTDLGVNWDNLVITPQTDYNFRYPSTIIHNPQGDTVPENMFAIFTGPFNDAIGWKGQYFGSIGMDGANKEVTYEINEPTVYLNHLNIDLNVTHDGKAHVASKRFNGTSAAYTNEGWEVLNGTFNPATSVVDWELPRVKVQPEAGDENRIDADNLVFSPDGSVGYLLGTGIDLDPVYNPYGVEWPIIYKTIDDGQTWEKIEPFDFSQIQSIYQFLYPTRADFDLVIPRWYNKWVGACQNGATVDINGNLHIAGVLLGTYSVHPDSLTYFYTEEPHLMFDVFMNGDGTWDAQYIDTIRTEAVASTTEFSMGWDQRVRMSRTDDGSKMFVSWGDTDPQLWGPSITTNLYPDLFIWCFDITNRLYTYPTNVTALGDYWGDNFFLHQSDKVIEQGDEFLIPISTSSGPNENGPITNSYFSGPGFNEAEYVLVGSGNTDAPSQVLNVSQNYPNPFNGISRVDVNLANPAKVSLVVYNLVGQKVYESPTRSLGAGAHAFYLNAAGFKPGIYMYTVNAGGDRLTRKMVVR